VDHVLNCFLVILAKVNHTSVCFLKLAAASAIEEARPRTQNCAMNGPLPGFANNGQVGIFSS